MERSNRSIDIDQTIQDLKERKLYVQNNAKNNVEKRLENIEFYIGILISYTWLSTQEVIQSEDTQKIINFIRSQILKNK